ncbi:MAG TPA: tetrahydromethanopterin S-methyltransferase subunit A [Thermoplasmata archaeon]|jgi:tetrahydromethanopterin S-methyltransferase subunit A|nr:MAG TPA: tetrahydromethanopterin S-methyltransferase subunit A [Thermoplasmata archaeon]
MIEDYYPWGGEFTACSPKGCVAVVLLNIQYNPPESVAIYGRLKTENIGIEKIIANTISNPYIRFLILCGDDIRGHRSGASLLALHKNGIDHNHRIIEAPGAIPYIENLKEEAIKRFQAQLNVVDLIGEKEKEKIDEIIADCARKEPSSFGEPYIAIRIKPEATVSLTDKRALHSRIIFDYLGNVKKRGE